MKRIAVVVVVLLLLPLSPRVEIGRPGSPRIEPVQAAPGSVAELSHVSRVVVPDPERSGSGEAQIEP